MESVVVLAIIATIAYYAYRSGKRIGSRKGFHAGRRRGRRWRCSRMTAFQCARRPPLGRLSAGLLFNWYEHDRGRRGGQNSPRGSCKTCRPVVG